MLQDSLDAERLVLCEQLTKARSRLDSHRTHAAHMETLPREIVENYYDLHMKLNFVKKKKQKRNYLRQISQIEEHHHNIQTDYKRYIKERDLVAAVAQYEKQVANVRAFVTYTVALHLDILEHEGFITPTNTPPDIDKLKGYCLTEKGEIATLVQEMHSLATSELLVKGLFDQLTSTELASVLSCFTSIRLSDDMKVLCVSSMEVNKRVKDTVAMIKESYDKYYDIETKAHTSFAEDYTLHYDMCQLIFEWCQARSDAECSEVLQKANYYGIVLGDFVKAVLKINNIAQELEKVCILQNNMKLLASIKAIPTLTMKSCVTNQSLYL
jgi:superfamily II RNA helicase